VDTVARPHVRSDLPIRQPVQELPVPVGRIGRHRFWLSSLPLRETCEHVLRGHRFLADARRRGLHSYNHALSRIRTSASSLETRAPPSPAPSTSSGSSPTSLHPRSNAAAQADIPGQSYEYLIKNFADLTNKKAGESYTPRSLVRLMVNILDPKEGESNSSLCSG
jgi:hypothetical protein